MLALREKSHYYVTSNLYMLPKIYAITFCANVKVLLAIVTLHNSLSLYVPFFYCRMAFKKRFDQAEMCYNITARYIRYINELHYLNY